MDNDVSDNDDPTTRVIKYHLGPDFLKLSTVGLTLNFGIGEKEVKICRWWRGITSGEKLFDRMILNLVSSYQIPTTPGNSFMIYHN